MTCPECPQYKIYYEPLEYGGTPCYQSIPDCRLGKEEGECEEVEENEEA